MRCSINPAGRTSEHSSCLEKKGSVFVNEENPEMPGPRYETFVPLYITNYCDSRCKICNMREQNKGLVRIEGNTGQILFQLKIIYEVEGISSVCFLTGEFKKGSCREKNLEKILWCINAAFEMGFKKVYFNIGSLYDEEINRFAGQFIGDERIVLSLFQETYQKECYESFFGQKDINNPKSNYELRFTTPQRWVQAGFKQVDLGILLGLRNPEYDLQQLIGHAAALHGMGATVHISLPRIRGVGSVPYNISDDDFKRMVSYVAARCPWSKLIVTTREDVKMIKKLLNFVGIISPGSSDVLPYTESGDVPNNILTSQFQVNPVRKRPSRVLDSLGLKTGAVMYYSN